MRRGLGQGLLFIYYFFSLMGESVMDHVRLKCQRQANQNADKQANFPSVRGERLLWPCSLAEPE